MKDWIKILGAGILVLVLICVLAETLFYFMTPSQYTGVGYLINLKRAGIRVDKLNNGFNEIDPLLGYAKTNEKLKAEGMTVEHGCLILSTTQDTNDMVNILITGGSTTDISLYAKDWPVELCAILKERGVHAKLYIAAVGGYNSGQELLKLIRDGIDTKPWVHISYSGANEFNPSCYVSVYEDVFYKKQFNLGPTSWLLPNTVLFVRDALQHTHRQIGLAQNINESPVKFWEKNMRLMHRIAVENNYAYLGVLQPVLGSGKYQQPAGRQQEAVNGYKKFYPEMKQFAQEHPDFMADMSGIFDTCTGKVFIDNCHIEDEYQSIVAEQIYNSLLEHHILNIRRSSKCD